MLVKSKLILFTLIKSLPISNRGIDGLPIPFGIEYDVWCDFESDG